MKPFAAAAGAASLLLSAAAQAQPAAPGAIERELGRAPAVTGDVQRFAFPRSDLNVMLDGIRVQPALGLGSWLAFRPADGPSYEVMGDLVLTQGEVKPVLQRLVAGGLSISALHNHLLRSQPGTVYMHVHGHGDPVALARTLHAALQATATPLAAQAPPAAAAPPGPPFAGRAVVERLVGRPGTLAAGGVLQFTIPRAHDIVEGGKPVPLPMGVATAINFQPAGEGRVASTGDFVLTGEEVEPVVAALTKAGIEVTALHNHMIGEQPRTFFMHFWGLGPPAQVAGALRSALEQTDFQRPAAR